MRLRSCSCAASAAWLRAMPVSPHLRLYNGDFAMAAKLRLGVTPFPPNAVSIRCSCGANVAPTNIDHAMVCTSRRGAATLRHDITSNTWRRVIRRAGVATSREPVLLPLAGRGIRNVMDGAGPSGSVQRVGRVPVGTIGEYTEEPGQRGDILLAMVEGLTVVDVSFVHPAADSFVRAAAAMEGAAAAARDKVKQDKYRREHADAYQFIPLSTDMTQVWSAGARAPSETPLLVGADEAWFDCRDRWVSSQAAVTGCLLSAAELP